MKEGNIQISSSAYRPRMIPGGAGVESSIYVEQFLDLLIESSASL